MIIRNIALFIHLLGVVTLFIAIGLLQLAGARARGAATADEAKLWLGFARTTGPMFPVAAALILGSGLFTAWRNWTFATPWIVVAIVSVVLLMAAGGAGVGRGLAAIERSIGAGPMTTELSRTLARPGVWVTAGTLNGMSIGLLWIMVNKPGWTHSIVAMLIAGVLGATIASLVVRPARRPV